MHVGDHCLDSAQKIPKEKSEVKKHLDNLVAMAKVELSR